MTEKDKNQTTPIYTSQDFEASGWQLAFNEKKDSAYISSNLSTLSRKAEEEGKQSQCELLRLLARVCSMALCPTSGNMPFQPSVILRTKRSAGPDDFTEAEIDFFQQILPFVTDSWLTARLADLLWLRRRREVGTSIGMMAIDAYVQTPITEETFSSEGNLYWMRALYLARMLKKVAGDREKAIENKLLNACYASEVDDGFLGCWIVEILEILKLGKGREEAIADKMNALAQQFIAQKDYHRGREYCETACSWFSRIQKEEAASKALALLAETWCTEATTHKESGNFIGATQYLEKAIESYRRIPHKHRETFDATRKLLELRILFNQLGPRIQENLVHLFVPVEGLYECLDEMEQKARQSLQGKVLVEALAALLQLYKGVNLDSARVRAEKELNIFHFGMFGSTTTVSIDGRVVKKRPPTVSAIDDAKAYEVAIEDEMLRYYLLEIRAVAEGYILPALETLVLEHRLTEKFFVSLCHQTAIIPPNRARAMGKALFSGYEFDFDSAIHRLIPQIEKMVRYHLRAAGVVTTTIDQGIENEVNLSALLKKPEAVSIFGKERVFEMDALFCETPGPQFRHGLAHGLLEDEDFASPLAAYVWWFVLKLILTPFQNPLVKE